MRSWKKYLPDWEIIEWNEDNYDVNASEYTRRAYENRMWAYVSDYARFDILNRYGGVYVDTDVLFKKTIPDSFLEKEAFLGFETQSSVAPGLIYGTIARQKLLIEFLQMYQNLSFEKKRLSEQITVCKLVTDKLVENGLRLDNTYQVIHGIEIFPQDYFCCFNHETQMIRVTENTICVHLYAGSWTSFGCRMYYKLIHLGVIILGERRYLWIKRRIKGGK